MHYQFKISVSNKCNSSQRPASVLPHCEIHYLSTRTAGWNALMHTWESWRWQTMENQEVNIGQQQLISPIALFCSSLGTPGTRHTCIRITVTRQSNGLTQGISTGLPPPGICGTTPWQEPGAGSGELRMVQRLEFHKLNLITYKPFGFLVQNLIVIPKTHKDHDGNTFDKELIYRSYPYSVCSGIDHFAHSDEGTFLFNPFVMTIS